MSKHTQVIVDGELYIPFNKNIKRCEYCVRDVNVCNRICQCVKKNMKYFVLRPSLKGKLRDDGMIDELSCPACGTEKERLTGESVHHTNWYCPKCSKKKEKYRVIDQTNVAIPTVAFTVRKGKIIEVRQRDTARKQVLIDFGRGYVGWFNESWLKNHAEPLSDEDTTE